MAILRNVVDTAVESLVPQQNFHLLNGWPELMIEDVWHFNQCAGVGAPVNTANDKGGLAYIQAEREYIGRELERACKRIANELNFWPCPAFFSEEIFLGTGSPIQRQIFRGRWLKTIALGSRGQTLIASDVAVVYSDPNQIGVNDTATITLNSTIANDEIKVYFREADGAPEAGNYRYEIEPVQVKSSGGVVTITGHRSLFVKPTEWARAYIANDPNFNSLNVVNTADAAGFVQMVDIYRVFVDTGANVSLVAANGTVLQTYTGEIQNSSQSAFRLGNLCADVCWDYRPNRIVVNYYAGSPAYNGRMDSELYEAIVALACAQMESKLTHMSYWCLEQWQRWHDAMVDSEGRNQVAVATSRESKGFFGARKGGVLAYNTVMSRMMYRGGKFF